MRVVIAGGGTGGHLFPGIALAEELKARGHEILFVGTARGIEARVLPAQGWPLELIDVAGIKRAGLVGALRGLGRVPRALWQSRRLLRRFGADLVVGVGGYASGPVVLTAALGGRPTAILEQNSIPGITNRILGKIVRRVYTSFAEAHRFFPARKTRLVGNPVRAALRAAARAALQQGDAASHKEGAAPQQTRLLVCGGSQGAHAVNELVAGALERLRAEGKSLPRVLHQTGARDREPIAARYAKAGIPVDVREFIDDMAGALADADVVVGRAGATTIAELTAFARPSLLIPFPFAADDHQRVNARALEQAGAAIVLDETTTSADALARALGPLLEDAALRARMSSAARGLGKPDAARDIADELIALCQGN